MRLNPFHLAVLVASISIASVAPRVEAQVILVNSFADVIDAQPGDCLCDTDLTIPGDQCTLRAAIMEANACLGITTIVLPPGTYRISISGGGENGCLAGDMDITNPHLTIAPAGGVAYFDANGIDRFFDVLGGGSLTLVDGVVHDGDPGIGSAPGSTSQNGGGIRVGAFGGTASLKLVRVTVSNNQASLGGLTPSSGGGIWVNGSIEATDSAIFQNHAKTNGGGLHLATNSSAILRTTSIASNGAGANGGGIGVSSGSIVDAFECSISQNSAQSGGGIWATGTVVFERGTIATNNSLPGSSGGGFLFLGGGTLRDVEVRDNFSGGGGGGGSVSSAGLSMDRVLFHRNVSTLGGGGLELFSSIRGNNVLFVENEALFSVGGALHVAANGLASLSHASIVRNISNNGGGGLALGDPFGPGYADLRATVFESNPGGNIMLASPASAIASGGSNLSSDLSFLLFGVDDWIGSAGMGPLVSNGGYIRVVLPDRWGPAIDSASAAGCVEIGGAPLLLDARHAPRPEDGNGDGVFACDRGAVELPRGCAGDCNQDGVIDGADLSALLAAWGNYTPCADLNGDGAINAADLSILLAHWGPCP